MNTEGDTNKQKKITQGSNPLSRGRDMQFVAASSMKMRVLLHSVLHLVQLPTKWAVLLHGIPNGTELSFSYYYFHL